MIRVVGSLLLFAISFSTYAQDLLATAYIGETSFSQYQPIAVTFTLKNDGIVNINQGIATSLYLSTDEVYAYPDIYVGYASLNGLNAGQSVDLVYTGNVTPAPGDYFLIVVVDNGNYIVESDESTNTYVVPVTITASTIDWAYSSLTISQPTLHPGEKIPHSFVVHNSGTTAVGGFLYYKYYISNDIVLDVTDTYIGARRSRLDGSFTVTSDVSYGNDLFVSGSLTSGQYYLIGKVDSDDDFNETNEFNNTFVSAPFTIASGNIDLSFGYFSASGDANYISATYDIHNKGTTGAGGYSIESYLSTDNIFDYSDQRLNMPIEDDYSLPYVDPGQIGTGNFSFPYFSPIAPGSYYLILFINPGGTIPETDYSNNTVISYNACIFVAPPPIPAVGITGANFAGSYDNTTTLLSLDISFFNSGDLVNAYVPYYLNIKDNTGNIVYSGTEGVIMNGRSVVQSWQLLLTQALAPGDYSLEITSSSSYSTTTYYQVPLIINSASFTLSGFVQGEDGTPLTQGKMFLYQKDTDGTVKFVNKHTLSGNNEFAYNLDSREYTLYFIPDVATYPEHVPTILGETVILKPSSFLTLAEDKTIIFNILKVEPVTTGPMSITGNVYKATSALNKRSAAARVSVLTTEEPTGYTVILLSSSGVPIKLTTTDSNGFYEFGDLPEDAYQVVVAFELDQPIMQQPVPVDVTETNAVVNIDARQSPIEAKTFFTQQITFNPISQKRFGDGAIDPAAISSSGLDVELTIADPAVAKIENGKIVILKAGKTTITATQQGNDTFFPAPPIQRELVVNKALQTITFDPFDDGITFGHQPFDVAVSSTSGCR